jgi:D-alanine-D-alanine ligase
MKKIVVLFDMQEAPPEDQNFRNFVKDADWDNEVSVKRALQRLDYEVKLMGLFDDIPRFIEEIKDYQPDLIFCMTESFRGQRSLEPQVTGLLDLLGIPYTGNRPLALSLCQNKELCKKILSHHRIRVPRWISSRYQRPLQKFESIPFPAFIKPMSEEGSEGISKDSFVDNATDCKDRVSFLHEKFKSDVLIEEYVEGRELYVSVLGNKKLQVFPIREIVFKNMPEDGPRFATYKTKWDEAYRKRWGIRNETAKNLSPEVIKKASSISKKAFQVLGMQGYARFDFRLKDSGELYLIEANPNPSIADYDDFACSAIAGGVPYDDLIQKIIAISSL